VIRRCPQQNCPGPLDLNRSRAGYACSISEMLTAQNGFLDLFVLCSFGKSLSGLHSSQMMLAKKHIRFIVYLIFFSQRK